MTQQPDNIKTYPPTTAFPNKPAELSREDLENHYLTLRGYYKGLMISRGQFAAKNRRVQAELQKYTQEQQKLLEQLSVLAKERKDLQEVARNLERLNHNQNQLIQEFQTEYEAIKSDKSNLLDINSFWEKFNRLMRAAYKLVNQGVMPKPVEVKEVKKGEFGSTDPSDIWRDINENK
jgi:chromosome segregation ATPase